MFDNAVSFTMLTSKVVKFVDLAATKSFRYVRLEQLKSKCDDNNALVDLAVKYAKNIGVQVVE